MVTLGQGREELQFIGRVELHDGRANDDADVVSFTYHRKRYQPNPKLSRNPEHQSRQAENAYRPEHLVAHMPILKLSASAVTPDEQKYLGAGIVNRDKALNLVRPAVAG